MSFFLGFSLGKVRCAMATQKPTLPFDVLTDDEKRWISARIENEKDSNPPQRSAPLPPPAFHPLTDEEEKWFKAKMEKASSDKSGGTTAASGAAAVDTETSFEEEMKLERLNYIRAAAAAAARTDAAATARAAAAERAKEQMKKGETVAAYEEEIRKDQESQFLVKLLSDRAQLPTQHGSNKSLYELMASEPTFLPPHKVGIVKTGVKITPPLGKFTKLFSRSGVAARGIFVEGGVIDEDYNGEIYVILYNSTPHNVVVQHGERICQFGFLENPNKFTMIAEERRESGAEENGPGLDEDEKIEEEEKKPEEKGQNSGIDSDGGGAGFRGSVGGRDPCITPAFLDPFRGEVKMAAFESLPAFMKPISNLEMPPVLDPNAPRQNLRGFGSTGMF